MKVYEIPLVTIVITWQETLKTYSKSILVTEDWKKKKQHCTFRLKGKAAENKGKNDILTLSETNKNAQVFIPKSRNLNGKHPSVSAGPQYLVSTTTN